MKNYLQKKIILMSRYAFIGLSMQLLLAGVLMANSSTAQNKKLSEIYLSVDFEDKSLVNVFKTIESKTGFKFTFTDVAVDKQQRLNLNLEKTSLSELLIQISKAVDLKFKRVNNNIHVSKLEKTDTNPVEEIILKQTRTISGKVTSKEDTEGLPGVNVVEKGTSNGVVTDVQGRYSLEVAEGATLVFSSVGYTTQEVEIGSKAVIDITMSEDVQQLEELVVIGYGSVEKANLTGAVGTASAERLEKRPITSAGRGLQGVIPNLNIEIRNGDPTQPANFNVRGFESINGGAPLILVDGVPMNIELINPQDIKSVNVLKDAAASAIYGARAAFGVVLIETKKGTGDKMQVNFSSEFSLARPIFNVDPVTNPHEYVLLGNERTLHSNDRIRYDNDYVEGTKRWVENPTEENAWEVVNGELRFYGNNNYQNRLITDFAPQNTYNFSVSGSSDKANYYASFGYLTKRGYLKPVGGRDVNHHFQRYNATVNLNFKINDWLSLDEKIIFNSQNNDEPHNYKRSANINSAGRVSPIRIFEFPDLPYYLEPGDREDFEQWQGMYFRDGLNWWPYLEQGGRRKFTTNDTWLTQGVTLTPVKGLKIRGDITANMFWRNEEDVRSRVEMIRGQDLNSLEIDYHFSANDFIENQINRNNYYVLNTYAEYSIGQNSDHYFKGMVGFNQEWGNYNMTRAIANSLLLPDIQALNATTGIQENRGEKQHVAIRGVFYRFNYIFKDKYLFELNGRYDGTSRFPKDSRFGFFPSASVGWRISNESFMDGTNNWLDDLKIRLSYGELGNQLLVDNNNNNIYYPYIPTMGAGQTNFIFSSGLSPAVSPAGLVSPALTWERVNTRNIGLDVAMWNQKLDFSFDYYIRDTKDMLLRVGYPDILGTQAPQENGADLRTQGWELAMTWRDRIGMDWGYGITLALSDNQAEITRYNNPFGNINDYYVGQKIGEIWGFETVGIFQSDAEAEAAPDQSQLGNRWRAGDIQYADLNGDGRITRGSRTLDDPGDLTIIGNSAPRYNFGINTDVSYKNWSLTIFFQGLFRDYLPASGSHNPFYPGKTFFFERWHREESWSEDNPDAYFPHLHIAWNNNQNYHGQSRWVQNAAYVRLKNLTLNYSLPLDLINKLGLAGTQIYFSGENLWEASPIHHSLDPEHVFTTDLEYFQQRIYTMGLRVTF